MYSLNFQENVPLKDYTTFRVGGPAKYFIEVDDIDSLMNAYDYASHWGLPIFILGHGSNLLVADEGFDGVVIKNNVDRVKFVCSFHSCIVAESGASMASVVKLAYEEGLSGMEWAAGLPGTVGGAVANNSGCNGGEMKDVVRKVRYFKDGHINAEEIHTEEDRRFNFDYRSSWFKDKQALILDVEFRDLPKGNKEDIKDKMQKYVKNRAYTQPHGYSVGCIFRNPYSLTSYRLKIISAGELIDKAGLKGHTVGCAQVSKVHGNFILNLENKATAEEIMQLIKVVEKEVSCKFGINLQREIICLGFEK